MNELYGKNQNDNELSHQLNNPKESNKKTIILLSIIIILIIGALVYIAFFMNPKDSNKNNENTTTTTTVVNEVTNNNQQTIKIVDKYYKIPSSYSIIEQKNNTSFQISDGTTTIAFSLLQNQDQKKYEIYKNDLTKLQNELKLLFENEIVISQPEVEAFNGIELIHTTFSNGNEKGIYFVCNTLYDAYISGYTMNKNNIIDKKALEDFVSIFLNETQETTNIIPDETIYGIEMIKPNL